MRDLQLVALPVTVGSYRAGGERHTAAFLWAMGERGRHRPGYPGCGSPVGTGAPEPSPSALPPAEETGGSCGERRARTGAQHGCCSEGI